MLIQNYESMNHAISLFILGLVFKKLKFIEREKKPKAVANGGETTYYNKQREAA